MKQLIIPEQHDIDIGPYGPACEGFIDLVKGIFLKSKDERKERLDKAKNARFPNASIIDKELEKDLKATYDNHEWVEKNLTGNSGTTKIKALTIAMSEGKNVTNPTEILKLAQAMANFVKEIARSEKPFIDLRCKLINEIKDEKDAAKVDAVWLKHAKVLSVTAADRCRSKKKVIPAIGFNTKGRSWPIDLSNPKDRGFNTHIRSSDEGDGAFEVPTVKTAAEFAKTIRGIIDICMELDVIGRTHYVPYWDCLAAEYDDLEYGDEIFSYLCSSQGDYEVSDLADGLGYDLGHIACGLYIVMFDKHTKQGEN